MLSFRAEVNLSGVVKIIVCGEGIGGYYSNSELAASHHLNSHLPIPFATRTPATKSLSLICTLHKVSLSLESKSSLTSS